MASIPKVTPLRDAASSFYAWNWKKSSVDLELGCHAQVFALELKDRIANTVWALANRYGNAS
jgi:uncharacterized protein involved in tellurium resistance